MPEKEAIKQMFDSIAQEYDAFNHISSLGIDKCWRRRAIKKVISGTTSQRILDLACGTGDFSIAIARRMSEGSRISAVDLSPGMLEVMSGKIGSLGFEGKVDMVVGEGEHLYFPENSFDVVTIAFGIRNFEDREMGLKEMLRVLKPGGRVLILELSVPENRILRWGYNLYFKNILPLLGSRMSGNKAAFKYLPASVNAFPGKEKWMETMSGCGFSDVRHKSFTFGLCRMYTGTKI